MADSFKFTIAIPFVAAFCSSCVIVLLYRLPYWAGSEKYFFVALLFWNMVFSLGLTVLVVECARNCFSDERVSFATNVGRSFRVTACIWMAATIGATPLLCIFQLLSRQGLAVPLGQVMLLQSLMTAWCVSVFTYTVAPATHISRTMAYFILLSAFFGTTVFILLVHQYFIPMTYFNGGRAYFTSPYLLYWTRFFHAGYIRPFAHFYPESLTLYAFFGSVLILISFGLNAARSRLLRRRGQNQIR